MPLVTVDTVDSGRLCPYCRFPLKDGIVAYKCDDCGALHHDDCWADGTGCAVLGCSQNTASAEGNFVTPAESTMAPPIQTNVPPVGVQFRSPFSRRPPQVQPPPTTQWPQPQQPIQQPVAPWPDFASKSARSIAQHLSDPKLLLDRRVGPPLASATAAIAFWILGSIVPLREPMFGFDWGSNAAYAALSSVATGLFGGLLVCAIASYDRVVLGDWSEAGRIAARAVTPAIATTALISFVITYSWLQLLSSYHLDLGLATFAWQIVWLTGFGLTVAAVAGASKVPRAWVSAWAIGGAASCALLSAVGYIDSNRIFSIAGTHGLLEPLAVALAIGVGIVLTESMRRQTWVEFTSGVMTGREITIFAKQTRIGSDSRCEICITDDSTVAPLHAWIENRGGIQVLHAVDRASVAVDGNSVTEFSLTAGTQFTVGETTLCLMVRRPRSVLVPSSP